MGNRYSISSPISAFYELVSIEEERMHEDNEQPNSCDHRQQTSSMQQIERKVVHRLMHG